MKSYKKGEYGYLKKYRNSKLIASIVFLLLIAFIVATVIIMFGDTKRVAIVFAILMALPLAKFIIAYILCLKFKPLTMEDYEYIKANSKDCFKDLSFDISITQYEGAKFYPAMLIKNGKVYAFVYDKNFSSKKKEYETWIKNTFSDTKYEYKVFVTDKLDEYVKKINSVSEANRNNKLIDVYIKELIFEKGV
ncbi:MAG: hypothetical protein J6J16_02670 [Lachnospiraceae bacterium]|nr:hypothetical protein [Lachnospiraceae bacterium]